MVSYGENYQKYREIAQEITRAAPSPLFYLACEKELTSSMHFLKTDSVVQKIQSIAESFLENNLGHTMAHSKKVAIEAGALMLRETGLSVKESGKTARLLRLAHCSGLLHDIARKEKNHAEKGSVKAEEILRKENFAEKDIRSVCEAIRRHEAFREYSGLVTPEEKLLSDCLYDSDKFRWGPDNFAYTVWDMLEASRIPVQIFLLHYKAGLRGIEKIRDSFRSMSGKHFGPEFIDIGMKISEILYREMMKLSQET